VLSIFAASGSLQLYDYVMFSYFGAFILYGIYMFWPSLRGVGALATSLLWIGFTLQTVFFVQRAMFYYHQHGEFVFPATNMFESISFFAWLVVIIYLIGEIFIKTRIFGVIAMIVPVAAMAYTAQGIDAGPRDLMPALKSYWLVFHVVTMFISYAAFALAFSFAIMYLLNAQRLARTDKVDPRFSLKFLDDIGYKLVLFGFPMATLGIFLGAVWANDAWGRYWGWDPKETWALITWFIYLAYLHLRLQWNWVGYRSALFQIIGFMSVLITFIGVNLLDEVFKLNSIHAYAEGGSVFMLVMLSLALLIPVVLYFLPVPKGAEGEEKSELRDFKPASSVDDGKPEISGE
jgi:cytochrome c-type biogenesis protein CcsB